jgi:hypothetical protein
MARSTKGLYKGGSTWWMTYFDALEKHQWESCKVSNKSEAEKRLTERRKEALDGVLPTRAFKSVSLEDFLDDYLKHMAHQRGVATKGYHKRILSGILGNPPIHALTVKVLEDYR